MALTSKQESFCQAIADGSSQADAYRLAYNAENMSDATIWVESSKLASSPNVSIRIEELKEKLAVKLLWTRSKSMQAMIDIAQSRNSQDKDKIAAVKVLNAMCGYDAPVKTDININQPRTLDDFYGDQRDAAKVYQDFITQK